MVFSPLPMKPLRLWLEEGCADPKVKVPFRKAIQTLLYKAQEYPLGPDDCSQSNARHMRTRWSKSFRFESAGRLILRFGREDGERAFSPPSAIRASFTFLPRNLLGTGISTSFYQAMQKTREPSIARQLREIRVIDIFDESCSRVYHAIRSDNLQSIQRMMYTGELRPWDRHLGGGNLLMI